MELLDLKQIDDLTFEGGNHPAFTKRIYGGQVLGQAFMAATLTAPADRPGNSMHGYFLEEGKPELPVTYRVEKVRDGGATSVRRVVASQDDQVIFTLDASFGRQREGLEYQLPMSAISTPESLPTDDQLLQGIADSQTRTTMGILLKGAYPVELRRENGIFDIINDQELEPKQGIWFRIPQSLPDSDALHRAALVYSSDMCLLSTAMLAHGPSISVSKQVRIASISHSVCFHRPLRMDEWLYYQLSCASSGGGRAYCQGQVFTREGILVASTTQEGVLRA